MSKKTENQPKAAPAKVETAPEETINPQAFSYEEGGKVEMDAEVFEIMRAYMREQTQKTPPEKFFMHQKPVPGKAKDEKGKTVSVVNWEDFETDEEYKNQKPIELRSVESFNAVYVTNLLEGTHVKNIEKGNALPIEKLREMHEEKEKSRLKKVEE